MSITLANIFVSLLGVYALIGITFALFIVSFKIGRIDPAAKNMGLRVRALITPGLAALWPLMLYKYMKQEGPPIS